MPLILPATSMPMTSSAKLLAVLDDVISALNKALDADLGRDWAPGDRDDAHHNPLEESALGHVGQPGHRGVTRPSGGRGEHRSNPNRNTRPAVVGRRASNPFSSVQPAQGAQSRTVPHALVDDGKTAGVQGVQVYDGPGIFCHATVSLVGVDLDEIVERFCIQTIDGGLSDGESIDDILSSLPAPSYDAILYEVAGRDIPGPGHHDDATHRWRESTTSRSKAIREWLETMKR